MRDPGDVILSLICKGVAREAYNSAEGSIMPLRKACAINCATE